MEAATRKKTVGRPLRGARAANLGHGLDLVRADLADCFPGGPRPRSSLARPASTADDFSRGLCGRSGGARSWVGRSAGRSPPTVAVASIWRVRTARSAVHVRGGSEPLPPARGPFDRRPSHSNEVDDFFNELLPAAGEHEGSRRPRLALARRRLRAGRAGRRDDGAQRRDVEGLAVPDAAEGLNRLRRRGGRFRSARLRRDHVAVCVT